MPFSRRPTSCLLIEIQILTIWPWHDFDLRWDDLDLVYDHDLRHVNQVKLMYMQQKWNFLWDDHDLDPMTLILKPDLDIVKMYHHTKHELSMSNASKVIAQTDRHTDTTKTLPLPPTREVIKQYRQFLSIDNNRNNNRRYQWWILSLKCCICSLFTSYFKLKFIVRSILLSSWSSGFVNSFGSLAFFYEKMSEKVSHQS